MKSKIVLVKDITPKKDLTNQKYGKLTVKEWAGRNQKRRHHYWHCDCECGGECQVQDYNLTSGRTQLGCNRCKGKDISKRPKTVGMLTYRFYNRIVAQAEGRWEFDKEALTPEFLWNLFMEQESRCALSGVFLTMPYSAPGVVGDASLDRIDSLGDYTADNVQWVHKTINFMKGRETQSDLVMWCCLVADNYRKGNIKHVA